jgi:hypothetical protein
MWKTCPKPAVVNRGLGGRNCPGEPTARRQVEGPRHRIVSHRGPSASPGEWKRWMRCGKQCSIKTAGFSKMGPARTAAPRTPLPLAPGGRPPPRHPRRQINAEDDHAHQGEGHAQEPHQGPVALQVSGQHQAKSAHDDVEGREGAGQVLHHRAGRHLAQPQPAVRSGHPRGGHEHGDQGEQGGHAHEAEQKHQCLVGFRHGQLPLAVLNLHPRSIHSDKIPAG